MPSKRTTETDISSAVRKRVMERDLRRCIYCHATQGLTLAHIVPRSSGGLGVEKNLVVACGGCHYEMDFTKARESMLKVAKAHIVRCHGSFDESEIIYHRGKA